MSSAPPLTFLQSQNHAEPGVERPVKVRLRMQSVAVPSFGLFEFDRLVPGVSQPEKRESLPSICAPQVYPPRMLAGDQPQTPLDTAARRSASVRTLFSASLLALTFPEPAPAGSRASAPFAACSVAVVFFVSLRSAFFFSFAKSELYLR